MAGRDIANQCATCSTFSSHCWQCLHPLMCTVSYIYITSTSRTLAVFSTGFCQLTFFLDPNDFSNSRLVQFVVMARVLRLGRLLIAFNSFQMFGMITVDIIPAASSVFMILLFILYFFASVGVLLYGGCKFSDLVLFFLYFPPLNCYITTLLFLFYRNFLFK